MMTLNNIALLWSDLGQHEKARELAKEALQQQKVLYDRMPQSPRYRSDMGMRYAMMAAIERRAGRLNEAAAFCLERKKYSSGNATELSHVSFDLGILSLLVGKGKSDLDANELAQRDKLCLLTLESLRESLQAGYRDFENLRSNRAFELVRQRPEFEEILKNFTK
jgi:hypothetical protein